MGHKNLNVSMYMVEIWQALLSHAECPEEGTRQIVAECFGRLTLANPALFLPRLKAALVSSSSFLFLSTIATALTFLSHHGSHLQLELAHCSPVSSAGSYETRQISHSKLPGAEGRHTALENPNILKNIFKFFSASFLLSSCSRVNKTWNSEARLFIRNFRKCTAKNPVNGHHARTFQLLRDLNSLCGQIKTQGREVPFNSLKIAIRRHVPACPPHSCCHDLVQDTDLRTEFELKYLEITEGPYGNPIQHSSVFFVREFASSEIQYLEIENLDLIKEILDRDDDLTLMFPELEELTIERAYDGEQDQEILIRMLEKSPKLKHIFVEEGCIWQIIPKEYYGLARNLCFGSLHSCEERERKLFESFLNKKRKLRKLKIEGNDYMPIKPARITQLFQSCGESLEELNVHHPCSLTITTVLPPCRLKNLSKFSLTMHTWGGSETRPEKFWKVLTSIGKLMPNLEEFELTVDLGRGSLRNTYPGRHHGTSGSVRKLKLEMSHGTVIMFDIKAIFPNVTSLEVNMTNFEPLPCGEIWKLWPDLEELKISGKDMPRTRNFDADFCGIHELEAVELRKMDEEYLRAVQIVPVRPSLLTMKSKDLIKTFTGFLFILLLRDELNSKIFLLIPDLRSLSIDVTFCCTPYDRYRSVNFISPVTELIALERAVCQEKLVSWKTV